MTAEDLQERLDFVADEIFKRWPDLKRGHRTVIPDDEKPNQGAAIADDQKDK